MKTTFKQLKVGDEFVFDHEIRSTGMCHGYWRKAGVNMYSQPGKNSPLQKTRVGADVTLRKDLPHKVLVFGTGRTPEAWLFSKRAPAVKYAKKTRDTAPTGTEVKTEFSPFDCSRLKNYRGPEPVRNIFGERK